MARFPLSLLFITLLFTAVVTATPPPGNSLPLQSMQGANEFLDVSRTTPDHTTITLSNPNIQMLDMPVEFDTYQAFGIDGEPFHEIEGAPVVPQVSRFYRIPNTGGVDLHVLDASFRLETDINPYPYHLPREDFVQELRDPRYYSADRWYPEAVAEISEPLIFRDFRVVRVTLNPVQVNPVTGEARVYENIAVEIVANGAPGENELLNPRPPAGSFAPAYRAMIPNLEASALDEATTTPGTYLFLSKDNMSINGIVDDLADWKQRKGMDVIIDRRTNWSAPEMITRIRTLYASADPPLEFVCIVGYSSQSGIGLPTDGSNYDHTFALGNTEDDLEDIGVGRLPASTDAELATLRAKILGYERDPYMAETDWFTKGLFYAGVNFEVASNWTFVQWADQQFRSFTGVTDNYVSWHTGDASDQTICNALNDGVCFFLWRGSFVGEMNGSAPTACNNGFKLPICFTITCATAAISEDWFLAGSSANPKGAVCGIGMQGISTHPPENYTLGGGFVYSIANLGMEYLGLSLAAGKTWLTLNWGPTSNQARDFSRWCNLSGDPGMSMWTDIPVVMDVEHPASLRIGEHELNVTVLDAATEEPIQDALVVAWKGTRGSPETYVKALSDENGFVKLPIEVLTAGNLRLTVTKRNHKPYYIDLPCTSVPQMVVVSNVGIDDDNAGGTSGNNDGVMNPGEVLDLAVSVTNRGTGTTGTNVSATLTSSNPKVSVVTGSTTFGDVAPGATVVSNTPLRVSVSQTMKQNETTLLTFTVNASGMDVPSTLEFTCKAGAVQFTSYAFDGPAIEPGATAGLRITFRNSGELALDDATLRVVSQSSFVTVDGTISDVGTVDVNASGTNVSPINVTANTLTFPGHLASMLAIVETSSGYRDSAAFVMPIGTVASSDPMGPDAYGYYAYDNTDTEYQLAPEFSYVNISGGTGTNLNIPDSGEKTAIDTAWSRLIALPFDFTFYGITYDTLTICANGWVAFGNQGWNDAFRDYPIPAANAPQAMIAPYWDDLRTNSGGQGVWYWHDTQNDRLIVQWKAGGGSGYSQANLDFEVILLNTDSYPTLTGNGMILVQYNDVTMNLNAVPGSSDARGSTVGIQDETCTVGLQYAHQSSYTPGGAAIVDGRAILYTTDSRVIAGVLDGYVSDAATLEAIEGATVRIQGSNYEVTTDASGYYSFGDILIGTYTLEAEVPRYNLAVVEDVLVEEDLTTTQNIAMLHPEFALSTEELTVLVPPSNPTASFNIENDGNGPLDYEISVSWAGATGAVEPWGLIDEIDVSAETGNTQVLGCEYADGVWYVCASGGVSGVNPVYRYRRDGTSLPPLTQPTTSLFGWYDMAWDGQKLYGGQDGAAELSSMWLDGTPSAEVILSPLNPTRAIAYDPATDHFWIADYTQDIFEIDRDGEVISQFPNGGANELSITGLGWDEQATDGYNLIAFSQEGMTTFTQVTAINIQSGAFRSVTQLESMDGDRAGGCTVTTDWNSALLVFGGIQQHPDGDRLGVYQIEFHSDWVDIAPVSSTVEGGGAGTVNLDFDLSLLNDDVYEILLSIYNSVLDTTGEVSVTLEVTVPVDEPGEELTPTKYSLRQNYPNPFNPSTTIEYDLAETGQTRLAIYNLVGQEIARLVDERQQAGRHTVQFDANGMPSGVYFYRLTSGDFSQTAKMMLMK